jgi:hypothetical protein
MSKKGETLQEIRERFERMLAEPFPDADPPPPVERVNAQVFDLNPWRHRRWTAEPTKTSSL